MKIRAYDNLDKQNIVFKTEFETEDPVSSFLIEKGLKEVPEHYFDNSLEGFNLRLNTKATDKDIEVFKEFPKVNYDNFDKDADTYTIIYELEILKKSVLVETELFKEFREYTNPVFRNIYDNVCDEYGNKLDDVEAIELSLF